jgi:methionyl-tRNA formyltransferase
MRILLLANNWVGWKVAAWLKESGEEIAGLVVHPPAKRKYGTEILEALGLPEEQVFDGSALRAPETLERIARLNADAAISVLFDYILKGEFIRLFPSGVINLHPSYLPFNRGQYPNVWSIVEGTPSGATVHYIDEGVDTGDIILQRRVPVDPIDTGETLYRKLEEGSLSLFKEAWLLIREGRAPRISQDPSHGTHHRARDVERIDEIDLDAKVTARELIDVLRARTFPPYNGAYFLEGGRKVFLRLHLYYQDPSSR